MNRYAKSTLVLSIIVVVFMWTVMGSHAQSRLDEIIKRGSLIVGTGSDMPPFGFIDEKGELAGLDIDIGKLLARTMFGDETKVQFVKQSLGARWENIDNGAVDLGIQGSTIHSQRPLRVAFTRGYIDNEVILIVRKDTKINKAEDLNSEKITIANVNVPNMIEIAKSQWPKAKVNILNGVADQFTAVKVGRAQAALGDLPAMMYYARKSPELKVLRGWHKEGVSNNAIFMKMNDFKLWLAIDTYVSEMLGGFLYDDYSKIYKKWTGADLPHAKYYYQKQ
jgi:polar amino acid transport system substrate-binding protein